MADDPLLEMRDVNKSFGAVQVLHDVDFSVYPGAGHRAGRRQRRRQVDPGQVPGRHPPDRLRRDPVRRAARHDPRRRATRPQLGHRDRLSGSGAGRQPGHRPEHVPGSRGRPGHGCSSTRDSWRKARDAPQPACRCARSSQCARRWPASPVVSGRRSPSPRPCCGTAGSWCWTSRTAALGVAQTAQVLALVRRLADSRLGVVTHLAQHERRHAGRRPRGRALSGPAAAEVRTADSSASQIVELDHDRALRVDWPRSRYADVSM